MSDFAFIWIARNITSRNSEKSYTNHFHALSELSPAICLLTITSLVTTYLAHDHFIATAYRTTDIFFREEYRTGMKQVILRYKDQLLSCF